MANPVIINPTLTRAGQAAAFNASNTGLELKISHVSFGRGHYDPTGDEVALADPVGSRVPVAGASRPTPYQIRMVSTWREDVGQVGIGEIAFWAGDVLAFVWSKADGTVASYKTDGVTYVLFNDLAFAQVPANSVSFVVDPDESVALAALAAHEGAHNAHPQYVLRAKFPDYQGHLWGEVGGTANAITLTLPAIVELSSYITGNRFSFKALQTNTGPTTINIDGVGAVEVLKTGGVPLTAGSILAGGVYDVYFDGQKFQLTAGAGFASSEATLEEVTTAPAPASTSWVSVRRLLSALALKAGINSPAFTGTPTAPTAAKGTKNTQLATTAFVDTSAADKANKVDVDQALSLKAPLDSPAFTGTPTALPPGPLDASQRLATTAFVYASQHGLIGVDVAGAGEFVLTDDQAGKGMIYLTGALTGDRTIILPRGARRYTIRNATSHPFKLTVKMSIGAGVVITQGRISSVFTDSANTFLAQTDFAGAALTDTPTAPTAAVGTNTDQIGTTKHLRDTLTAYGVGVSKVLKSDIDALGTPSGFYSFSAGATSFAEYSSLIKLPYVDDRYSAQIGLVLSGAEPKLAFRTCYQPNVWGPTRYAWHDGNFDPTAKADKATTYTRLEADAAVRSTLNAYGLGATNTGSVSAANQLPTLASGHYYYAADFSPYGAYAFVQRTTYAGNRGFEVANIPYTDRFFGRSSNVDGTWRAPIELATAVGVQSELAKRLIVGGVVSRQQPVLASPITGASYDSGALVLREALEAGGGDEREIFAPGIGFHWFQRVAGKLVMDSVGKLKWNGNPLMTGAIASQTEVDAGNTDVNVVTPTKMRFGFAFIKAGSGGSNAIKFPTWLGGFMVQWGVHTANNADAETTVTFPLEFSVIPGLASILTHDGAFSQTTIITQSRLLTTTGFMSRREDAVNATSLVAQIRWIAVGF